MPCVAALTLSGSLSLALTLLLRCAILCWGTVLYCTVLYVVLGAVLCVVRVIRAVVCCSTRQSADLVAADWLPCSCEHVMNVQLRAVIVAMTIFCVFNATGCSVWTAENRADSWYLYLGGKFSAALSTHWYGTTDHYWVWIQAFFTGLALFSLMIPLSLYITVEFIKFMLGQFVSWDSEMYRYALVPVTRESENYY